MALFQDIADDYTQMSIDLTVNISPPYTEDMTNDIKFMNMYN
jgi:hypothetical protein